MTDNTQQFPEVPKLGSLFNAGFNQSLMRKFVLLVTNASDEDLVEIHDWVKDIKKESPRYYQSLRANSILRSTFDTIIDQYDKRVRTHRTPVWVNTPKTMEP